MMNNQYEIRKVNNYDLKSLKNVCDILFLAGKDMADKYKLHHWDNSRFKTWIIIFLCALKNDIYVVYEKKNAVATFQLKKQGDTMFFRKLATLPQKSGKGIGSFCMTQIEKMAKSKKCRYVKCEVYDKSKHAINFYKKHNYIINGSIDTLKYTEIKMEKEI